MRQHLQNLALVVGALVLSAAAAEGIARWQDEQPLFAMPLVSGSLAVKAVSPQDLPLAQGVSRSWFATSPPPLANRGMPPAEWQRAIDAYRSTPPAPTSYGRLLPDDMFRAWNAMFAAEPCRHPLLAGMPSHRLYLFDPANGTDRPIYRYMPNVTTPAGLVTNAIGWRGPPLRHKKPGTIRIVFVGASTTAEAHETPYSYPELLGHWLGLWAAAHGLDLDFQSLNAGREGMTSTDVAAIVRDEVAPMRPDLVVYYEGANQFDLSSIARGAEGGLKGRTTLPVEPPSWLATLARYSEIAVRLRAALTLIDDSGNGREPAKPDYTIEWPPGLDEADPDLRHPSLPVSLTTILRDLDDMRATLRGVGAELAVSSFVWLVHDGMVVDPLRGRFIWENLNRAYWPWRYRDMERLALFQNRVFEKYARQRGVPFIDVARDMPRDPELFGDAIHTTATGVRVRAWVVLQQLVPIMEDRLKRGAWPSGSTEEHWPTFAPRAVDLVCKPEP
ncbi:MAG: hypothetical protein J0J01_22460 [Reyranella sp.]|uniref:SGNH/GDSL hydrolase family protein n=1 Tax=Reyranella sp. TaxID=1929291 RepID=UPI001AC3F9FD|nr:hypothetical protein [Reyranella sp.]MBN9089683.1 hypothetical protein [Reyranella sp.]